MVRYCSRSKLTDWTSEGCIKDKMTSKTHYLTTIFVDTRLCKTKHPRKWFQNFHHSCELLTDQIEIHQSRPLVWPSGLLYVMLAGCDWWISIRSVNDMYDWRKFWKRFRGCFVVESHESTKMVVKLQCVNAAYCTCKIRV